MVEGGEESQSSCDSGGGGGRILGRVPSEAEDSFGGGIGRLAAMEDGLGTVWLG